MSSTRISTGISELDAMIEGGLRCGKTYLVVGESGNTNTANLLTTYSAGRSVRGIEEYLVSGTFVLEMELSNSRFIRTLTIEKMRSTALAPAQYIFNIMQDRGIVLLDSLLSARQSSPSESAPDDR